MKRFAFAGLALVLGVAACDSPSDSGPSVASLNVSPASRTVSVGETVQLTAEARDGERQSMPNAEVRWTTLDPSIVSVSTTGLATGVGAGTGRVEARSGGATDTARIQVVALATNCSDPGATPAMAVGETRTLSGASAGVVCLDGAAAGADYTIIPFHASESNVSTVPLTVQAFNTVAVSGPGAQPAVSPALSLAARARQEGDGGFHMRLNQRAAQGLSRLVPSARARYAERSRPGGPRMNVTAQAAPALGQRLQINVATDKYCEVPTPADLRTGRVVAVSSRAVVVADTANPANGFTQADYDHVATTFDTLIHPVVAGTFGETADLDENGRAIIFYTRAVNELTPANENFVVGGFFYSRDLFPKAARAGFDAPCAGSNNGELFYMLVPDPTGEVNGNVRPTSYVRGSTLAVVAHEFQHLINASRRLYLVPNVNDLQWNEDAWLNEGLSHISEELLFYHRTQLGPRRNLGAEVASTPSLRAAFGEFQDANYGRFGVWLDDPSRDSPHDAARQDEADLATRGAAWSFLRYSADRRGGDQRAFWYGLVNNNRTGFANVRAHIGAEPLDWMNDWAVAAYTDDLVPNVAEIFTRPSWNHRALYRALQNGYPLEVLPLTPGSTRQLSIIAGGAAYLRTSVAGGGRGTVSLQSGGAAPRQALQVTVVRTR